MRGACVGRACVRGRPADAATHRLTSRSLAGAAHRLIEGAHRECVALGEATGWLHGNLVEGQRLRQGASSLTVFAQARAQDLSWGR